ncbi:MAG: zinc-binding dehydrogenase [Sandaracinaceae bacterium]|nr:zinc-binding dehydrogenase [Sandaracinaceae bacterium]
MPRRIIYRRYGEPSVLAVETFSNAAPTAHQLTIDVAFSGINFGDCIARRGFYSSAPKPPGCVGFEVSGTVSAVGSSVTTFKVGDRVLAVTRFGGYSSEVVVDAAYVSPIPNNMSFEDAAAIPAVYLTAWHSLYEIARARKGESILIQAVAGGVGIAALQLAKSLGLTTYGTASSDEKLEVAKSFGLDHGINYARDEFKSKVLDLTQNDGVDIVLDSLGGEGFKKGYECLARGGKIITIGAAQVAPAHRNLRGFATAAKEMVLGGIYQPLKLIQDNRTVSGVQILYWWDKTEHLSRGMREILALYKRGIVRPVIDSIFTFDDVQAAHARLESRVTKGKLLLRP